MAKYYYKLSGEAKDKAIALNIKIREIRSDSIQEIISRFDFLKTEHVDGENKDLQIIFSGPNSTGCIIGIPSPHNSMYSRKYGYSYFKNNFSSYMKEFPKQKGFMCPKMNNAKGKQEDQFWKEREIPLQDEVLNFLGIKDKFQIHSGTFLFRPGFQVLGDQVFFVTAKKIEHQDAQEIPYGEYEEALENYNLSQKD